MADTLVTALDISNYQGNLTQDNFNRFKEAGVQTVICGTDGNTNDPVAYPRQIEMAKRADLKTEAYIFLYHPPFVTDMPKRARLKLDMIDSVGGVKDVWMDGEDTAPLDAISIHNMLVYVRAEINGRGYDTGIYTGRWWWIPRTEDNHEFTDLRLWLASYDGIESLDISEKPMSGWTSLHRKQLSDKANIGGYGPLDYDIERAIVVPPAPPEPVPTSVPQVDSRVAEAYQKVEEAWRLLNQVVVPGGQG